MHRFRPLAAFIACAALLCVAGSFADGEASGSPSALQTTANLIAAGSENAGFDATVLVGALTGRKHAAAEMSSLAAKAGPDNLKSFLDVLTFAVSDAAKLATADGRPFPAPSSTVPRGKELATALYTAGVTSAKPFDVDTMLDALVTHPVNVRVMKDIDAKYGPAADANYRAVLARVMLDLKTEYRL